jgi:hypothetical protein
MASCSLSGTCSAPGAASAVESTVTEAPSYAPLSLRIKDGAEPKLLNECKALFGQYHGGGCKAQLQKVRDSIIITINDPSGPGVPCSSAENLKALRALGPEHFQMGVTVVCTVLNKNNELLVLSPSAADQAVSSRYKVSRLPRGRVYLGETLDAARRRIVRSATGQTLPVWPAPLIACHASFSAKADAHTVKAIFGRVNVELEECLLDGYKADRKPEWISPALFYAGYRRSEGQHYRSIFIVLEHLASDYRLAYEFEQNGCYVSARALCKDPLMYDLCHMAVNNGSVHRNDTHALATALTKEYLDREDV